MSSLIERKKAFAELPVIQALGKVKCGFELETQAVDGLTYEELEGEELFDEEGFFQTACDNLHEFLHLKGILYKMRNFLNQDSYSVNSYGVSLYASNKEKSASLEFRLVKLIKRYLKTSKDVPKLIRTARDPIAMFLSQERITLSLDASITQMALSCTPKFKLDKIEALALENIEYGLDRGEFYSRNDEVGLDIPTGIIAKADNSVKGPEFVVAGNGTTAPKFIKLLKSLFDRFDLEIDEGCSFHIHLSVPGINHAYGPMLQCHMMEYLLLNVDRVPEDVQNRWGSETDYFKPLIQADKYSFVHFHENCRTWEFRCFGNVQNAKDGRRCLKLAVEALQYAYKVSLGMAESLFKSREDWHPSLFHDVIDNSVSLITTTKKLHKDRRNEGRQAA